MNCINNHEEQDLTMIQKAMNENVMILIKGDWKDICNISKCTMTEVVNENVWVQLES